MVRLCIKFVPLTGIEPDASAKHVAYSAEGPGHDTREGHDFDT
jgi:hypothetical protein